MILEFQRRRAHSFSPSSLLFLRTRSLRLLLHLWSVYHPVCLANPAVGCLNLSPPNSPERIIGADGAAEPGPSGSRSCMKKRLFDSRFLPGTSAYSVYLRLGGAGSGWIIGRTRSAGFKTTPFVCLNWRFGGFLMGKRHLKIPSNHMYGTFGFQMLEVHRDRLSRPSKYSSVQMAVE